MYKPVKVYLVNKTIVKYIHFFHINSNMSLEDKLY